MAEAIKTRIQLKNDTEENWNKATNFVPKQGELIIYSTDAAHPFPRLKTGDGRTSVINLPFIGLIQSFNSRSAFPQAGNIGNLYLDTGTNNLYSCTLNGYTLLNVRYTSASETIRKITNWDAGSMTVASVENNTLIIENGTEPTLSLDNISVVTSISPN